MVPTIENKLFPTWKSQLSTFSKDLRMGMKLSPEPLPFTPTVPQGGSLFQDTPLSCRGEAGILVQKQKTYHIPTATKATTQCLAQRAYSGALPLIWREGREVPGLPHLQASLLHTPRTPSLGSSQDPSCLSSFLSKQLPFSRDSGNSDLHQATQS